MTDHHRRLQAVAEAAQHVHSKQTATLWLTTLPSLCLNDVLAIISGWPFQSWKWLCPSSLYLSLAGCEKLKTSQAQRERHCCLESCVVHVCGCHVSLCARGFLYTLSKAETLCSPSRLLTYSVSAQSSCEKNTASSFV